MSFLIGLLYVVEVIVCLLLALAVMLQKPKEGGLGGAIGGGMSEAVFGADASNVLIKVTIWLGSIFLANTLLLARLTAQPSEPDEVADTKPANTKENSGTADPTASLPHTQDLPVPAADKSAETTVDAEAKAKAEAEAKAKAEAEAKAKAEAEAKAKAEAERVAKAKAAADAEAKARIEKAKAEAAAKAKAEAEAKAKAEAEAKTKAEVPASKPAAPAPAAK